MKRIALTLFALLLCAAPGHAVGRKHHLFHHKHHHGHHRSHRSSRKSSGTKGATAGTAANRTQPTAK